VRDILAGFGHYRDLLRQGELHLPVSENWARRLVAWGAPPARVRVARMGVVPGAAPRFDRPFASPLRLLAVGRLVAKKGFATAIEALGECPAEARLEIVGYGALESELRHLARARGLEQRVSFSGRLPHDRVIDRIAAADILLVPSVTAANGDMEGIPVVAMEAMARGTIVVATDHSGVRELLGSDAGLLVPEESAAALAAAVGSLAGGAHDLAALRRAARARIEQDFDNAELNEALAGMLEALRAQ
jgi:colanic acid/amylovoran biosynthesis glycosyltransferase